MQKNNDVADHEPRTIYLSVGRRVELRRRGDARAFEVSMTVVVRVVVVVLPCRCEETDPVGLEATLPCDWFELML